MSAPVVNTRWIEAIHAKLTLAYGPRFKDQYTGLDQDAVIQSWAEMLRWTRAEGIRYALEHLPPDFPPNAMQFKALCKGAPNPERLAALTGPGGGKPSEANAKRLAAVLAGLKGMGSDPKAWAYRLRDRDAAGERLTPFQAAAWKAVCPPGYSAGIPEASNGAGSSPSEPAVL